MSPEPAMWNISMVPRKRSQEVRNYACGLYPDLQNARIKTAIGNLANTVESNYVNQGRLVRNAKGVWPR